MANSRDNVLMQLGDYCTTHTCKNCPLREMAAEHHHGCPEFLRVPELAEKVSDLLKGRRTHREEWRTTVG